MTKNPDTRKNSPEMYFIPQKFLLCESYYSLKPRGSSTVPQLKMLPI